MNKTITIYTLLGLVKDGKAPKEIKYNNNIYILTNYDRPIEELYVAIGSLVEYWFNEEYVRLNDEVEILDEEDEFIEIKCVSTWVACDSDFSMKSIDGHCLNIVDLLDKAYKEYSNAINQLIHNQKILIEKMKDKE